MISRVRVKNFRSLADVDVELGPLTVLVGRNGAGKSAFLDALCFVRDSLRLGINEALRKRNGLMMLQTWHSDGVVREMSFEVFVQLEGFSAEYGFAIAPEEQGAYSISREYLRLLTNGTLETFFDVENGEIKVLPVSKFYSRQNMPASVEGSESDGSQFSDPPPVLYFNMDPMKLAMPLLASGALQVSELLRCLTDTHFYGMFPTAKLREPQMYYHDFALFEDGANLAALLNHKQTRGVLPVIKAALRGAIPDVRDLAIDHVGNYLVLRLKHKRSDGADGNEWFDLTQESDGTVHLLTILAALYQSLSPGFSRFSLVSIEEPEAALYPAVLSLLADVIKEASCRSQIIITTQSPDFISEFGLDTLRVAEKVNGVTHIGPLDQVQAGIIHDQLFTTGDLLRVEGLHSLPRQSVSAEDA